MQLATFTTTAERDEHPLTPELRDVIVAADQNAPRSLQVALGPSEIGEPCARRLAYRLMDEARVNTGSDPWAAIVGTSVHAWLADAFLATNTRLGRIRYLVEQRVEVRPGLEGSCDLYDVDRAAVIDHKVVGPTNLRAYRINGPPEQYRIQGHAYGMALSRLGLPVREVCLAFYPRSTDLSDLHVWSQLYDPDVITAALARHDQILELAVRLDVEHQPGNYQLIPRKPEHRCHWCPWFRPGPETDGSTCPGDNPSPVTATAV
jgi:hypothetical protein